MRCEEVYFYNDKDKKRYERDDDFIDFQEKISIIISTYQDFFLGMPNY